MFLWRSDKVDYVGINFKPNNDVIAIFKEMKEESFHGQAFWRVATAGESAEGMQVKYL